MKKTPRLLNDAKLFTDKIQDRFQQGEFTYLEAKEICDSIPCLSIIISQAIGSGVLRRIKRGVYILEDLTQGRANAIFSYAKNKSFNRYVELKRKGLLKRYYIPKKKRLINSNDPVSHFAYPVTPPKIITDIRSHEFKMIHDTKYRLENTLTKENAIKLLKSLGCKIMEPTQPQYREI